MSKPITEWTEEEWEIVQDERVPYLPLMPSQPIPLMRPENGQNFNIGYDRPCMIDAFFRQHPKQRVAMIACPCPKCSVHC